MGRRACQGWPSLLGAALLLLLALALLSEGTPIDYRLTTRGGRRAWRREYERNATLQYPLTPLGKSIKRVILVAMLPSVCRSNDWRGELPRYLTRYLPRVPVINWNARQFRIDQDRRGRSVKCGLCPNPDFPVEDQQTEYPDCAGLVRNRIGRGDLVVVIGTGSTGCAYRPKERDTPECNVRPGDKAAFLSLSSLDRVWDKQNTLKVHIPVRNLQVLSEPRNIFGFDHIIPDDSFFKPMGGEDGLLEQLKRCYREDKKKDLLYVARYHEYKGQLKFVQQANPALLHGFTIHFYGSGGLGSFTGRKYAKKIMEAAEARGIKVAIHGRVKKRVLMDHACRAGGQIMWPQFDNNPRAAYEGLYAGMPLFISTSAGIPVQLLEQEFVTPVDWRSDLAHFNAQLASYMQYVKASSVSRRKRKAVVEYTETALNPDNVYWEVCERIGVCAHKERVKAVIDDEDSDSPRMGPTFNDIMTARGKDDMDEPDSEYSAEFDATMAERIGEI